MARAGIAETYRVALREYREAQGGNPEAAGVVGLFGKEVDGLSTIVHLNTHGPARTPVLINEWVVEAGQRVWIVRTSQQVSPELTARSEVRLFRAALGDIELTSPDLSPASKAIDTSIDQGLLQD